LPSDIPFITVVVCTRGRPLALTQCLDSLRNLDDPRFETLVVNNNSNAQSIDTEVLAKNGFRVVHEQRRGLDHARNRGIVEARGDIVAFIDDDCIADPEWLTHVRKAFRNKKVVCVTGRVVPTALEKRSHRWFENVSGFDRGKRTRRFVRDKGSLVVPGGAAQLGTGCNMAFRRELFDRIGGFDPALDMGTAVGGGGDIDMFVRVLQEGEVAVYTPRAVVQHSHRDTLWALARQLFGYSASVGALSMKYAVGGRSQRRRAVKNQLRWLMWKYRRTVRQPEGSRLIGVPLLLICIAGNAWGPFAYFWSRWRARRRGLS
jgi:GT2 family glycosyltransferase